MNLRPAWSAYNEFQDRDRDKPLLSQKNNQLTNIKPRQRSQQLFVFSLVLQREMKETQEDRFEHLRLLCF